MKQPSAKEETKRFNVWDCPKCKCRLVEKRTKDYVDERINRMSRFCKQELKDQKAKIWIWLEQHKRVGCGHYEFTKKEFEELM
jgi:hypothetical protein